MRKAKNIFQGKNEPVWVRPTANSASFMYIFLRLLHNSLYMYDISLIITT